MTKIKAKDITCMKSGCKNKGYRWIYADLDIKPICYCKKHIMEFEMEMFDILEGKRK